jgi:hypothetical protein
MYYAKHERDKDYYGYKIFWTTKVWFTI